MRLGRVYVGIFLIWACFDQLWDWTSRTFKLFLRCSWDFWKITCLINERRERESCLCFLEREMDHPSPSFVGFFSRPFDGHVAPLWALDLVQRDSCTGFPMVHHMPWPLDPNFNPSNALNLLKSWSLNLDRMATSVFFIFLHF